MASIVRVSGTITALTRGGMAAKEGKLRVGDVIVAVDGVSVKGRKAVSTMDESATQYSFTIMRDASMANEPTASSTGGDPDHVDMEGWLVKVKAENGKRTRKPEKRWVVLQGSTLSWYKDSTCLHEANSQTIENAACVLPKKASGKGEYSMNDAMSEFAKVHKFPFMLEWPNKQLAHQLVFAASTSGDRAAWAAALRTAITRAQSGAPNAGWLFKEGGRKTRLAMVGWKRRWFVLGQGDSLLNYYESPTSSAVKGYIPLRGAEVFVPRQVLKIKSDYKINFCVASQDGGTGSSDPTCTLLAATTMEERDMWVTAIQAAAKPQVDKAKSEVSTAAATSAPSAGGEGRGRTASRAGMGTDAAAAALDAGAEVSLEQLKWCDADQLQAVRIKKLKQVLAYMDVDITGASEKKDLVNLIVKHRGAPALGRQHSSKI